MNARHMLLPSAIVLKEFIVFDCSLIPSNVRPCGRSLRGRLQVMGRAVRQFESSLQDNER